MSLGLVRTTKTARDDIEGDVVVNDCAVIWLWSGGVAAKIGFLGRVSAKTAPSTPAPVLMPFLRDSPLAAPMRNARVLYNLLPVELGKTIERSGGVAEMKAMILAVLIVMG